jgi:methylmalonyl-CoA/ethylmalonyl-CoA epimerase
MLKRLHHINLLVRDLSAAVRRYREVFQIADFRLEELPHRGVRTARFPVGESWVVLVEPTDPDSVPGRHLARHGEGLFLLSFEVADAGVVDALDAREPGVVRNTQPRDGLADWQVYDLDAGALFGATLQLTVSADESKIISE